MMWRTTDAKKGGAPVTDTFLQRVRDWNRSRAILSRNLELLRLNPLVRLCGGCDGTGSLRVAWLRREECALCDDNVYRGLDESEHKSWLSTDGAVP